jgi:DUF1680 family protein
MPSAEKDELNMQASRLSRRGFLTTAAATGGVALLGGGAAAQALQANATRASERANRTLTASAVEKVPWQAKPFPMAQVRLLPGMWNDMKELDRSFLYSLPNDRLAHNFRVTAGIASNATPLGGWEAPDCELRGHYVGHYLSACALMSASTGDTSIRDKADALVVILGECQQKGGYLGAYPTTFYDKLRNHEKVWAPFYTYHKIMAGLLDMYEHTGNAQALVIAEGMADWAIAYTKPISDEEWQKILLVEQGGMNEASFNLYAITAKTKYRDLGYRFEHKKIFDPLAAGQDELAGNHANTNIPKVIGAARGYEVTGDVRYARISQVFYEAVTQHHSYCTGGTSNGEFWQKPDAIAAELGPAAQECCCVYNMMKLSRHMFGQQPDARHFDYYERVLYNVRRGTQDRNGMLMYYVSLKPGLYKTFGTPFDAFWCCTGTGSEEYAKLTDSIYFHDEHSVYVNLFIPSTLDWVERGLRLKQTTKFPDEDTVRLTVEQTPAQAVALRLRIPYWATSGVTVSVNGEAQHVSALPGSYALLEREWMQGDVVELHLPMSLHIDKAADDAKVQAAMYGPLVLAALLGTEGLTVNALYEGAGPDDEDRGVAMPEVTALGVWFEQAEASGTYSLRFRSKGQQPVHTLVPLAQIMDERYSVYLRNTASA